jgi:hypothetical protein
MMPKASCPHRLPGVAMLTGAVVDVAVILFLPREFLL